MYGVGARRRPFLWPGNLDHKTEALLTTRASPLVAAP